MSGAAMTVDTVAPPSRLSSWELLMANRLAAAGLFVLAAIVILAIAAVSLVVSLVWFAVLEAPIRDWSPDGDWSLMLPTRGGSTSIMLARGVVPTIPDGDLLIILHEIELISDTFVAQSPDPNVDL